MDDAINNIITGYKSVNLSIPATNTVANTAAETNFNSTYTILANSIQRPTVFSIKLWGVYSAAVASTLRGKVKLNTTAILDTGALTGLAASTNLGWSADFNILFQSIGASAVIDAQGFLQFSTAATTALTVNVPNINTMTIDTTIDQIISLSATWNTASASNSITLRQMILR